MTMNKPKPTVRTAASLSDILGTAAPTSSIPNKWKKHHAKLLEMQRTIRDNLSEKLDEHRSFSNADSRAADLYDQASLDSGFSTSVRSFKIAQEKLSDIELALRKINAGTFGICSETGKSIAEERLLADPSVKYSAEGAQVRNSYKKSVESSQSAIEKDDNDIDIDLNVTEDENAFLAKSEISSADSEFEHEDLDEDEPSPKKERKSKKPSISR